MRLILHIGTAKTGTTALQGWLHRNSQVLKKQGFFYSKVLGRPNNRKISIFAGDAARPDVRFNAYGISDPDSHTKFSTNLTQAFRREVAEARESCGTFIISNEHLHSRVTSDQMVARVAELLGDQFSEIEVVCCLRPQVDLLVSRMSVSVRAAKIAENVLQVNGRNPYYDYLALWERWQKLSPNFTVIPFKRTSNISDSFAQVAGISTENCVEAARVNEKVDFRTAALGYQLDRPMFLDGTTNKNKNFFVDHLPVDEPISISRAQAREIQARFAEKNAELAARSGLITEDDLCPNYDKYPEQGNFERIFEPISFAPVLQEVVVRFNVRLWMERVERHIVEAKLALAENRLQDAGDILDRAEVCVNSARQPNLEDADWDREARGLERAIRQTRKTLAAKKTGS